MSGLRAGEIKIERVGKVYRYRSRVVRADGDDGVDHFDAEAADDDALTSWSLRKVEIWALREVTCHIRRGERVAVIGANGAGKSTLLRILSRTLPPSEGSVESAGIVIPFSALRGPLSPYMSGCDNLRMIARLLGLPALLLEERLPAIIEFSEIGSLAHEKVYRYSDRSFARLSMAMALFVDADIFLVEDNIKVGDELYRLKFTDKLAEVLKRDVTLVYASNSLDVLRNYCEHAIWLDGGRFRGFGDINTLIRRFLSTAENAEDLGDLVAVDETNAPAAVPPKSCLPEVHIGATPEALVPVTEWLEATARAETGWSKALQRWREKLTPHDLDNCGSLEMADKCKLGTIRAAWCLNSEGRPVRRVLPGETIAADLLVETFSPDVKVAVRLELDALLNMLIFVAEPLVPLLAREPGLYLFRAKIDGNLLAYGFENVPYKLRTRVVMSRQGDVPQMVATTVRIDLRGDVRADFDEKRAAHGEPATAVLQPTPAFVGSPLDIEGSERSRPAGNLGTQWDKLNRKPALRPRLEWMVYHAHEIPAAVRSSLYEDESIHQPRHS